MALGIAGEQDVTDTVALDDAAREEIEAVAERPHRPVEIAGGDEDAGNRGLDMGAAQKIARLGEARKAPRRDMRHRNEPGAPQPDAGGNDVVMGDACRGVDKDRHSRCEKLAQALAGAGVARRQFEREAGAEPGEALPGREVHQPSPRLREITKDSSQNHNPPYSRSTSLVASR
jgi:hypothetical protein